MGEEVMEKLLEIIKTEFPERAIDISESLELLKETIEMTMESIEKKQSKAFAERKLQMLNWMTKDEAMVLVPPSPEETNARLDVNLLNEDETPWPIENMNEDHMTYIVIYSRAIDTEAKRKAIEARTRAYIASWQAQLWWEVSWVQTALASANASQLTSQLVWQQGEEAASIAEVAQ